MLSKLVGVLFVILLVAGVPALSFATARSSQVRQIPRLSLYLSASLSQWLLAGLGGLVVLLTFRDGLLLGFRTVPPGVLMQWGGALVVASLAGLGASLFLGQRGWWPEESELVYLLIPETPLEKLWSVVLLAPTAALCEEFLYRGYLLSQLGQWCHSASWGVALSSLAFGLAHIYQGWSGMVRAALLGALLAYPVVRLGSLYPSMVAHGLIDALALAWLGPKLLPQKPVS